MDNSTATPEAAVEPEVAYGEYVLLAVVLIFGVMGNWLTLMVMRGDSFRSLPVSKLFTAMSLSDIVVSLLLPFNKPYVRHLIGADVRALSAAGCRLFFWTYRLAKTGSSWTVVLITMERFIAVWLPTRARLVNTDRHVNDAMVALYGALAVFFGYWCSWADRIVDGSCVINSQPAGYERLSGLFLLVGIVLYSIAPAIILLTFNSLIVYRLVFVRRKITPSAQTASTASSSRTTVMLLAVAVSFVILVMPNTVAHVVLSERRPCLRRPIRS